MPREDLLSKKEKAGVRRMINNIVGVAEHKVAYVGFTDVNPINDNAGNLYTISGSTSGGQLDQGVDSDRRTGDVIDIHRIEIRFMTSISPAATSGGGTIRCIVARKKVSAGAVPLLTEFMDGTGANSTYTALINPLNTPESFVILKDFSWNHILPTDVHATANPLDQKIHKIVLKFKKPVRQTFVGPTLSGFASLLYNGIFLWLISSGVTLAVGGTQLQCEDMQRNIVYTDA